MYLEMIDILKMGTNLILKIQIDSLKGENDIF